MTRNEAVKEAKRQADETFTTRWIVTTTFDPYAKYGRQCAPIFDDVEGYEIRDTNPTTEIVYREVTPRPVFATADEGKFSIRGVSKCVYIEAEFVTAEAAISFGSRFPKSAGVRAFGTQGGDCSKGLVTLQVKLCADGVNGGRNETGIRRVQKTLSRAPYRIFGDNAAELAAELGIATERDL